MARSPRQTRAHLRRTSAIATSRRSSVSNDEGLDLPNAEVVIISRAIRPVGNARASVLATEDIPDMDFPPSGCGFSTLRDHCHRRRRYTPRPNTHRITSQLGPRPAVAVIEYYSPQTRQIPQLPQRQPDSQTCQLSQKQQIQQWRPVVKSAETGLIPDISDTSITHPT